MESSSGKLQIWDGWKPDGEESIAVADRPSQGLFAGADGSVRLFLQESLLTYMRRRKELPEPFSLPWFLEIEDLRHGRHGRWIPRLLEFAKHAGDHVLGMGPGLGTDWAQYARRGAEVIACSPSAEQLGLVQRNFQLRGLPGRFIHARPTALPLNAASIDVACVSSFLNEAGSSAGVVDEIYRVLKPGGKVLAVVPAAYDIDFWCRGWLPWIPEGRSRRSWWQTTAPGMTGRGLRHLFDRFSEIHIHKRQLRRQDVPHLLRWAPLSLLERAMGRFLILKAFKPLSAALPMPAAA